MVECLYKRSRSNRCSFLASKTGRINGPCCIYHGSNGGEKYCYLLFSIAAAALSKKALNSLICFNVPPPSLFELA